ncbi:MULTISPECIES: hypothetical protein [Bacillus cereus group]|uniref:Uncharacterized protein n=1 Tax=Bacillus cereus VD048 TaxID=1053226 RepID=J8HLF1_BACCE|nr:MULTISPECIES: hypothetical protein [Bacillus cereus group]EJR26735.1 hypothetical protein IIG_05292 [Bacillus cereus VD048]EJR26931.1 hypothetical protein IIG_05061 [Bacillus cereus VD048]QWG81491.1 hypothetical protein EXW27_28775 [Bacillus mycoides]QWI78382.1 hypothetical protein JG486_30495 [Bacillus mycoides]TXR73572.1 hypothetical protein DN408_24215 [Bacillus sp. AR13-1]
MPTKENKTSVILYHRYTTNESLAEYIYIFNCLEELKITVQVSLKDIPFNNFYKSSTVLDELREIEKERGGNLLSAFYVNSKTPLKWHIQKAYLGGKAKQYKEW